MANLGKEKTIEQIKKEIETLSPEQRADKVRIAKLMQEQNKQIALNGVDSDNKSFVNMDLQNLLGKLNEFNTFSRKEKDCVLDALVAGNSAFFGYNLTVVRNMLEKALEVDESLLKNGFYFSEYEKLNNIASSEGFDCEMYKNTLQLYKMELEQKVSKNRWEVKELVH